jgi:hypothetical protein
MTLETLRQKNMAMLYKEENIEQLPSDKRDLIRMVRDTLEHIYPNNYDIHFTFLDEQNSFSFFKVIIKFPLVTIKNSRNESHLIRDLFVKISMGITGTGGVKINNLSGARTTVTYDEYHSSYCHSHLSFNKEQIGKYKDFCTGSGEINNIKMMFNGEQVFNKDIFKLYLFHLQTFVSWESIEGTPYRYMSSIGSSVDLPTLRESALESGVRELENWIIQTGTRLPWTLVKGVPVPAIPEEINKQFASTLGQCSSICMRDSSGNFKKYFESTSRTLNILPETLENRLLFRGELIPTTIIPPSELDSKPVKYTHPQIINYAIKKFKYKAKEHLLQSS